MRTLRSSMAMAFTSIPLVRIGYDQRWGDRLTALAIVPLGNTSDFNEALQQAAMMRAERGVTHPASRHSE